MLFSLSNLKKRSTRDADGEQAVVPKLLHGRAALRQVGLAIELFEGFVGKARSECDMRLLEGVMGDYRLGRCIEFACSPIIRSCSLLLRACFRLRTWQRWLRMGLADRQM